jgi:glycosyltransferase involved in cell wall biosynthesis
MQPVPILYTIPNLDTAGSGRALLNIVTRLDRRRFAPSICVLRRGGGMEQEIERLGVPFFDARFTVGPRPLASLPVRARRAARAFPRRYAIWHSFHYLDDYTEPLVARFAGARAWIYTKKNMSWNRRSWWIRTLLARRVAAQNRDMLQNFFDSPLFRGKSHLVPRGVDTERFRPGSPRRLELRARLRVPAESLVVGCVAQLVPVKGHAILLDAIARVPGARLWLAGRELDPAYSAGLRERARELGVGERVDFLGGIDDVPALLAELDIFVLPTPEGEGCPVALLEAMASGLPSVAADASGFRDVIEPGRSGMLVSARDGAALGDAFARLASDAVLRRQLGEGARARILQAFSIDAEVRAHEELYADALGLPEAKAA